MSSSVVVALVVFLVILLPGENLTLYGYHCSVAQDIGFDGDGTNHDTDLTQISRSLSCLGGGEASRAKCKIFKLKHTSRSWWFWETADGGGERETDKTQPLWVPKNDP
jgi:hypothetical protein